MVEAASGAFQLVLSVAAVSEIVAGPWRYGGGEKAEHIENALAALPGVVPADLTWDSAIAAAELRGRTGLLLPDALIVASSLHKGVQILVTNDAGWKEKKFAL